MKLPVHFSILLLLFVLKPDPVLGVQLYVLVSENAGSKTEESKTEGACSSNDAAYLQQVILASRSVGKTLSDGLIALYTTADVPIFKEDFPGVKDDDLNEIKSYIKQGVALIPDVKKVTKADEAAASSALFTCATRTNDPPFALTHRNGGFQILLYTNFFQPRDPRAAVADDQRTFNIMSSPRSSAILLIAPLVSLVGVPAEEASKPVYPAKLIRQPSAKLKENPGFFVMLAYAYYGKAKSFISTKPLPALPALPSAPGLKSKMRGILKFTKPKPKEPKFDMVTLHPRPHSPSPPVSPLHSSPPGSRPPSTLLSTTVHGSSPPGSKLNSHSSEKFFRRAASGHEFAKRRQN